ncbi:helix-turn-helix domain-containing protein [Paenibacillus solisilvae]|uniref:Helix-turn-helix domain-containing protein n=1 Tax=Paenibacillus solisilvae TaxID=2486751 RepID=A0ABW0W4Z9_9BACL
MKRSYFKSRLFLQYMLSYLIILLVPLVLLTVLIYQSAASNLRTEIERAHLNQLDQARTTVDARMSELSEIASRISYDNRLTSYRVHDAYYSSEAINALGQYKATSSIIGEAFLYFHGDDRIYSTAGMSSLEVFSQRYNFHNWSPQALKQDLNQMKFPTMRPADLVMRNESLEQSLLAYMVPITPNSPNPHGTLLYLIDESEFRGLISSILGNYQGLTYVFDNKGHVLTANQQGESLSTADTQQLFAQPGGIHSQRLNGKTHSVVSVKSELNGWTYVTAMESSQFFSSVSHIRSVILFIFVIVLAAGAIIALMLALRQYFPISDLADFASTKADRLNPGSGGGSASDELAHIRRVLLDSSLKADRQEPYARNHYLLMLLKYGDAKMLPPDLMDAFHIRFDRSRYMVLVIEWEEDYALQEQDDDLAPVSSLVSELTEREFPELSAAVHAVELPEPGRLALIVGFDQAATLTQDEQVQSIVAAIRQSPDEQPPLTLTLGVGTVYDNPDHLNQSYIEACSAFESRLSTGPGSTSYFTQLNDAEDKAFWLPASVLLKLTQSLKQGNFDVAVPTIGESFVYLQSSGASLPLMRCMCFDILNVMLKAASELGITHVNRDIPPLSAFSSLEELENSFLSLASRICSQVESNAKTEELTLMDRIITYIDEHYGDHSLSLESISHEYAISPSHFSRSFKEKFGLNFTQYVWQKREEEVKRQLETTSDPLKDIIQRVGYQDTPNFIRKFKKETGLTPGQYRKQHAESSGAVLADEDLDYD